MIDPRAVIEAGARIADDVSVGPFSVIGPDVSIGPGTRIGSHVMITGHTTIGAQCRVYHFTTLGESPQDTGYRDEPTRLVIGDRNVIREYVTISRGTPKGGGVTRIGNENLIMAYVHIAHDCEVGDHTVFANAASLAGHVSVGDHAILGGFTLVHQFCRIGPHAFTSMGAALNRDLTPYTLASGNYARAVGINKLGLQRRGFPPETVRLLHQVFKLLVRGRNRQSAMAAAEEIAREIPEVERFVRFVKESKRGIVRSGRRHGADS
ncbi:acyl-[acyl-carrier-protein]--UDP-N-acetylglucosamine O-acyltransferase [Thioalkalivibrio denitrificans]|uniref:Acyl-[acyl-carrier-protein]--UDP-N-acetylglucosamine O-acyltransferase n=1 Tax=Thioalkalivibrio denitrificans TaxID=108003 RepID=A0A1V3NPZ2_9GAMM|nr:acyl-ACP--UDP-N-acetylglucosamine O-acyltransferase [Thioalkalivibrio denitrificans]OOG27169.1 acyl-[acyl-carrier-protein]--UDP-N-acetylglucosamine O-acyltransferase [Thioalkalivibrio denitrificans]